MIVIWNIVDGEIQIIEGDQKDDFPLWEVHIKKTPFISTFHILTMNINIKTMKRTIKYILNNFFY